MQVFPRADIFLFSSDSTAWIPQFIHSFCCLRTSVLFDSNFGQLWYICYEYVCVDFWMIALVFSNIIESVVASFSYLYHHQFLFYFSSFPALILLEIHKIYQFLWMANCEHPLYTSVFYFTLLIFTFLDIFWGQFAIFPSFLRKELGSFILILFLFLCVW